MCYNLSILQIHVEVRDGQTADVSWSLPQSIECNGKVMGLVMELNSTLETQLINIEPNRISHRLSGKESRQLPIK